MQSREHRARGNRLRNQPSAPAAAGRSKRRARLSSLIDEALAGRLQRISRRGAEVAVLVSAMDYDRLMAPRESLVQFFRNSPLAEATAAGELELERDPDVIRDLPWRAGCSTPTLFPSLQNETEMHG